MHRNLDYLAGWLAICASVRPASSPTSIFSRPTLPRSSLARARMKNTLRGLSGKFTRMCFALITTRALAPPAGVATIIAICGLCAMRRCALEYRCGHLCWFQAMGHIGSQRALTCACRRSAILRMVRAVSCTTRMVGRVATGAR